LSLNPIYSNLLDDAELENDAMKENSQCFADNLKSGKLLTGIWVQIPHPEIVEIIGYSGYDFVIIDLEHGHFGFEMVESMVRAGEASGAAALVRVPENNEALIMKVLDTGAAGIIVPTISTREATLKLVSASKYFPEGKRGSCPCVRSGKHFVADWTEYATRANRNTVVLPLIESVEGVANYKDIIGVRGVDGFLLGPFDLSVALGEGGNVNHPKVREKFDEIISYAASQKVPFITTIFESDPDKVAATVQEAYARGCRVFAVAIDKQILAYNAAYLNRKVRETLS
jgi:4-hydroxy-2-oxoheptanedioate aldolase